MRKNENEENGRIFALTAALMNILILTIGIGMFWLVQIIISQINRFNDLVQLFSL